jgi:hypothetical protein
MMQKQRVDDISHIDGQFANVEVRIVGLEQEVFGVKREFRSFRDWVDERCGTCAHPLTS